MRVSGLSGARGSRALHGRGAAFTLVAAALLLLIAQSWEVRPHVDDAYIFYRYARNLVAGNGLVYNVGEYVDANTSFAWPWLIAAGMLLGADGPTAAHWLDLASSVAVLLASYWYASVLLGAWRPWIAATAPWIVLASVPFTIWSNHGMETPLFTAGITIALAAQASGRLAAMSWALVVTSLARPEGMLLAGLLYFFEIIARRGARAPLLPGMLVYALVVAGMVAFRCLYYGSPLPNTFYAKVGGIDPRFGLFDVGSFLATGPIWLLPAIAAAFRFERRLRPGLLFALIVVVYDVRIGGDSLGHNRFLVPILPTLGVAAVCGAVTGWRRNSTAGAVLAALVTGGFLWSALVEGASVLLGLLTLGTVEWFATEARPIQLLLVVLVLALAVSASVALRVRRLWPLPAGTLIATASSWLILLAVSPADAVRVGDDLNPIARERISDRYDRTMNFYENFNKRRARIFGSRGRPDALVAVGGIGVFGYFSMAPVIDLYGLVDPVIARSRLHVPDESLMLPGHIRSNPDYVLGRKPAYILIPRRSAEATGAGTPAEVDLWRHPEFSAHYVWDPAMRGYRRRPGSRAPRESE